MLRDLLQVMTYSSPGWNRGNPSLARLNFFIFVQLRPSFPEYPLLRKESGDFHHRSIFYPAFLPALFQVFPPEILIVVVSLPLGLVV